MEALPLDGLKSIIPYLQAADISRLFGTGNPQIMAKLRHLPISINMECKLDLPTFPKIFRHFSRLSSLELQFNRDNMPSASIPAIDLYPPALTSLKLNAGSYKVYELVPYGLSSLESLEVLQGSGTPTDDYDMDKFWNGLKLFPQLRTLSAFGRTLNEANVLCLPTGLLSFGFRPTIAVECLVDVVLALPRSLTSFRPDLSLVKDTLDKHELRAAIRCLPPSLTFLLSRYFLGDDFTTADLAKLPPGLKTLKLLKLDKPGMLPALPSALTRLIVATSTSSFDGESALPSTLRELELRSLHQPNVWRTIEISFLPHLTRLELKLEIPIPANVLPTSLISIHLSAFARNNPPALYNHRPFVHLTSLRHFVYFTDTTCPEVLLINLPLSLTYLLLEGLLVDHLLRIARYHNLVAFVAPTCTGIILDHHISAMPRSLTHLDLENTVDPSPLCLTMEGWNAFPPRLTRLCLSHALPASGEYKPPPHLRHLVSYEVYANDQ